MTSQSSSTNTTLSHLAIIPAREGSKRLPNKNIRELHGKPLIFWSIKAALDSAIFNKVIVSTDSTHIAEIARDAGAEVPFMRSEILSSDSATSVDVCIDAIDKLSEQQFDVTTLLQPTSPLRTAQHIREAWQLFCERQADGVISVCPCEHPPQWSEQLDPQGNMRFFLDNPYLNQRSQDLQEMYRLNGALYMSTTQMLKTHKSLFPKTDKVFAYVMDKQSSIDIDTQWDFDLADFAMARSSNPLLIQEKSE